MSRNSHAVSPLATNLAELNKPRKIDYHEADVIKLVLEFLDSRSLHSTMLALERESGIQNVKGLETIAPSDDLLFLRQLILDGCWDDALDFVQPLHTLPGFDARIFTFVVLKHKFLELLCLKCADAALNTQNEQSMQSALNTPATEATVQELVACLQQLEQCAPSTEQYNELCLLLTLKDLTEHPQYQWWNPTTGRVQCFSEIQPLVAQYLQLDPATKPDSPRSAPSLPISQDERLVQLLVKGLLYEACIDFCQAKATEEPQSPAPNEPQIPVVLNPNSGPISEPDFSLVNWIQALPADMFNYPFEQRAFSVSCKPLVKPKLESPQLNWLEQIAMRGVRPQLFPFNMMPSLAGLSGVRPKTAAWAAELCLTRSVMIPYEGPPPAATSASPAATTLADGDESARRGGGQGPTDLISSYIKLQTSVSKPAPPPQSTSPRDGLLNKQTAPEPKQRTPPRTPPAPPASSSNTFTFRATPPLGLSKTTSVPACNVATSGGQYAKLPSQAAAGAQRASLDNGGTSGGDRDRVLSQLAAHENRHAELRKQLATATIDSAFPKSSEAVSALSNEQLSGEQVSFTRSLPRNYGASSPSFQRFSPVALVEDAQAVRCAAFHPLGAWVAFGCNSRTLRIAEWPAASQTPPPPQQQQPPFAKQVLAKQKHHKGSIYCIAWSAGGELIATGSNDKTIKLQPMDPRRATVTGTETELLIHEGTVRDLCFLEDASARSFGGSGSFGPAGGAAAGQSLTLLSAGAGTVATDCRIQCSDCGASGGPKLVRSFAGHSDAIYALYSGYASNEHCFVSGSADRTAKFWDLRSPDAVLSVPSATGSAFASVCVDSSGRLLISGHEDATALLYDIRGGRVLQQISSGSLHSSEIRSVRIAAPPAPLLLLAGSYDTKISVTDLRGDLMRPLNSGIVGQHTDKIIQCRWRPVVSTAGATAPLAFVSTSADKTARFWQQIL